MRRLSLIIVLFFVMAACSSHDDNLPQPLPIIEPPEPINLSVSTQDLITYDLSWEVDDPSVVSFYTVYVAIPFSAPEFVDSTTVTSVQVDVGFPLAGLSFCVGSVTVQNVESSLVCASAE